MNIPKVSTYLSFGIIGLLVALHIFGTSAIPGKQGDIVSASALSLSENNPFAALTLEAHSVYVYDLIKQKEIFSREPDRVLPLASLAKLMVALLSREMLDDEDIVTVNGAAVQMDGDDGFLIGERFTVSALRDAMLIASSNDAAYALAAAVAAKNGLSGPEGIAHVISLMNDAAQRIELVHTAFFNPTGLDLDQTTVGALGTAREIALLARYILDRYPSLLGVTRQASLKHSSLNGVMHEWTNTNKAFDRIPGLIATKTGFTDLAGGNLLVVFDIGIHHPVIAVVLGSSFNGRFDDMEHIVRVAYQYIR